MLELARQALVAGGWDVWGAYLSPVNDAYWKKGLAPGRHRLVMCQKAVEDSDFIMVDGWEVEQGRYTRTLHVLEHLKDRLRRQLLVHDSGGNATTKASNTLQDGSNVRVMLVCGADVVESMADASVWKQDLLEVRCFVLVVKE